MTTAVDVYNTVVSVLAAAGLLYLLYSGRYAVNYRRFFRLITFGLFLSVLGGPLPTAVSETLRHALHGTATLFIAIGLYDLLRGEFPADEHWLDVLTVDAPEETPAGTEAD